MDIYSKLAERIIKEQEGIIGPIALEQAQKVPGLVLHWDAHEVELSGDEKDIVDKLIIQYKALFGEASVRVCKDAVQDLIAQVPQGQIPSLLS